MRLFHKLIIALFATTALVLVINAVVSRISLGGGFVDFLVSEELALLEEKLPKVAALYSPDSGWARIEANPRLIHGLFAPDSSSTGQPTLGPDAGPESGPGPPGDARFGPKPPGGSPDSGSQSRPPPPGRGRAGVAGDELGRGRAGGNLPGRRRPPGPGRNSSFQARVFLLDHDGHPLVGPPEVALLKDQALPLIVDSSTVGWVGVRRPEGPETDSALAFMQRQNQMALWTVIASLVAAGFLAWLLARHLTRPVGAVAVALRSLADGRYGGQVQTKGRDELAALGQDVNHLSRVLAANETARQRWTADISHELRTPLAILLAELDAIDDGVRQPDAATVASLRAEARHLSALINDLHLLAQADAGALDYRMERLDLGSAVRAQSERFIDQIEAAGLALEIRVPDKPVWIQADPTRIVQLLRNLLENSIRYTASGGQIVIVLSASGLLSFEDTAPGVNLEDCERLFERFFRAENSRNRRLGGSGLGLAICANIAQAHDATINAVPSDLGGLRIEVKFPLRKLP